MYPAELPILGQLTRGSRQRHAIKLPGLALGDEPRPVISLTGARAGPLLFVNAGVHGGEYPAIEAVIRLGKTLDPEKIAGTVILMPVVNLPAFWSRTPFVCPIDNVNPNRVFPGDPNGGYSEQMVHALMNEFIVQADAYIDLHGGDLPEALVPFTICRGGSESVDVRSKELALAFGLSYVLTVDRPLQPAKGCPSYVAAAERGIPAILAEAGGAGQLQEDAVELLVSGVKRVMRHLEMMDRGDSVVDPTAASMSPTVFTAFQWVYARHAGIWYSRVAAGDLVQNGQEIGSIGSLFGERLERVSSPVDGRVLFLTINPAVRENGLLMGIGVAK